MKYKKKFYPPIYQYIKRILFAFFAPLITAGIILSLIEHEDGLSENYLNYIAAVFVLLCVVLLLRYSWLNLRVFVVYEYGLSVKRALFWGKRFFTWQDIVSMKVPVDVEDTRPRTFILSDAQLKKHEIPYHLSVKSHHKFIDTIEYQSGKTVTTDK